MRSKSRFVIAAAVVVTTIMLTHSCFRQEGGKGGVPKIDRAQLCRDGGATVNEATNECECSTGLIWNGVRCDVDRSVLESRKQNPSSGGPAETDAATGPAQDEPVPQQADEAAVEVTAEIMRRMKPAPAKPESEPATAPATAPEDVAGDSSWIPQLIRACRIAGGDWLQRHKYCHCPDGKVLMGRRCRLTYGRMTDDVCLRAVNKGVWKGGICECPRGKVFSPGRGGCVEKFTGDSVIMRRICENTVNQGKWIQRLERCRCPDGHILVGETCVLKTYLRSEDVCESFENGGTWNAATKRCACPAGKSWINQSCSE
jgi:hypothetical protein